MTCLKWLKLLNEPLKKSCVVLIIWKHYFGFLLDVVFGLTWRMLTHVRLIQSHHKLLWSFSFWLLMPSYASINVALSLCMIMAVIALFLVAPSLLLALILYWVWALLVHPTPKNQVFHYVHYKFLCMVFASHSKQIFMCYLSKNLQNTSRFVTLFLAHGDVVVGFTIFHIVLF
jgi:hypothetical protein